MLYGLPLDKWDSGCSQSAVSVESPGVVGEWQGDGTEKDAVCEEFLSDLDQNQSTFRL